MRHLKLFLSIRKEETFSADRTSMMSAQITEVDKVCWLREAERYFSMAPAGLDFTPYWQSYSRMSCC
jgi:hypothetical protein